MDTKTKLKLITSETPTPELGLLMKASRTAAGLDQAEIAEELGLSRQSVSDAERGKVVPMRATVIAWCVITGGDFEKMDKALADAWFARNGGTKRTVSSPNRASSRWLLAGAVPEWALVADDETFERVKAETVIDLREVSTP